MKLPPMRVAYAAVLLLTAGCASVRSDPPVLQPKVAETQPATPEPAATPQPAATPVTPATPQPAPAAVPAPGVTTTAPPPAPGKVAPPVPPVARTPAPVARAPQPAAPPVVVPPAPVAPLTLDLKALTEQLKATKAIGIFTKLALRNQVDDLLQQFREHYEGKTGRTMTELRQSYNLLMMKVLSLLQDDDQKLASAIVSSREAIWGLLANPKTFATLQS